MNAVYELTRARFVQSRLCQECLPVASTALIASCSSSDSTSVDGVQQSPHIDFTDLPETMSRMQTTGARCVQRYNVYVTNLLSRVCAAATCDGVDGVSNSVHIPDLSVEEERLLATMVDALDNEYDVLLEEWVSAGGDQERALVEVVARCAYGEAIGLLFGVFETRHAGTARERCNIH